MTNGATGQPIGQQIQMASQTVLATFKASPIFATAERIFQPVTDFIRGNPILSTAAVGIGTTGLIAGITAIRKRRKAPKRKAKRKKAPKRRVKRVGKRRRPKKRTKAELREFRCRCLAKARRSRKKKHIIRGRGLGRDEIRHSGRSTKGKMRVVSFRNKKTGKMVRFKVRK